MNVALALGLGLAAGAAGTVVLTLSETVEQRLTGRESPTGRHLMTPAMSPQHLGDP
nr:hypothetical protein [Streptomyces chryseus]